MNDRSYALPARLYRDPAEVIEYVQEQSNFDDRLRNWIRWARVRRWQSITCGSAEGRYVAPDDEKAALSDADREEAKRRELARDPWPIIAEEVRELIADAWEVECTWRMLCPAQFRYVLAFTLHRNWDPRRVCRALQKKGCGIHHTSYDDLLRRAKASLRNRLS